MNPEDKYNWTKSVFSDAHKRLSETSFKSLEESVALVEKMALYSGGIISLSITFVGFLLDKYRLVLAIRIWCLPLYWYLVIGWTLLALCLLLSLFVRWAHTVQIGSSAEADWLEKGMDMNTALEDVVTDNKANDNPEIKPMHDKAIARADDHRRMRRAGTFIAALCFTLGIFMLIFVATNVLRVLVG